MKIRRLEGVGSQHILPRLKITDNKYCITVMQSTVQRLTRTYHATYFVYFMFRYREIVSLICYNSITYCIKKQELI